MCEKPNVVLICVDQWRGDALGIDGHPFVETPYLDHLGGRGLRCTRAYSATPTCIAARAALFTGLSQANHGRVGYRDGVPWNYPVTIAGEFARQGYHTQAVGKMHVYPERSLMGFHAVDLHDGYLHYGRKRSDDLERRDDYLPWLRERAGHDADYFDHGLGCNAYTVRPWDKEERLHPTNWVVTRGIDFLRRRDPRKPFFLFLSFHRPHPPFDPPAWALQQYLDVDMPAPPMGDWVEALVGPRVDNFNPLQAPKTWPRHRLDRARAGYYGHVTHIDHQVNRFIEALDESELTSDTLICFVSDHGDLLGDHHLFAKGLPYEGSARVPFLLAGPGVAPRQRLDAPVELRDTMPTLLDAAGLEIPEGIDGRSLMPLLENPSAPWRQTLHGEHLTWGQAVHYVVDGRWKYVWYSGDGHEQVFDLAEDPQETHDLAAAGQAEDHRQRLRAALIEALTGREEGFVQGGQLVPGRPVKDVLDHIEPS